MVLLARELEAEESYSQLKRGWDSFNDLTNQDFLFIMPAPEHKKDVSHYIAVEGMEWRRIGTPDFVIMNDNVPMLSKYYVPPVNRIEEYHRLEAIKNNTNHVAALCDKYRIRWDELPAIMLFSTNQLIEQQPIVIPIVGDKLYQELELLIVGLQTYLEQVREIRAKVRIINDNLDKKKAELNNSVIPKKIQRFLEAKELLKSKLGCMPETERDEIVEAINKRDYKICIKHPQPLRGELNRIIDYFVSDENIEREAEEYCRVASDRGKLELEVNKLLEEQESAQEELYEAYHNLSKAIRDYENYMRGQRVRLERENGSIC